MSLLDWFRPRWRHSDPDVRSEAVRTLVEEGRTDLLLRVVHGDTEARVRRIALKKIDDPQVLRQLADADPDEGLRKLAGDKATELLTAVAVSAGDEARCQQALDHLSAQRAIAEVARRAAHQGVRRAALAKLRDESALADVARHGEDPHLRQAAVARIDDRALLRDIAMQEPSKEVALAALGRITDAQALDQIAKRAKSKALRAAAQEKLGTRKTPPAAGAKGKAGAKPARPHQEAPVSPEARQRARKAQLCIAAEAAAQSGDLDAGATAMAEVTAAWSGEFGNLGGDEYQKRFSRAVDRLAARRAAHDQQLRAHSESVEERERETEQKEAERLARAAESVEKAAQRSAEEEERQRFEAAARERMAAERAVAQKLKDEERARRDKEREEEKVRRAAEREGHQKRADELAARLEALVEVGVTAENRKQVEQALKEAQTELQSLDSAPRERFQAVRDKIVGQLHELREAEDWKRWANVPRLEALVEFAEKLATAEDIDVSQIGHDLKILQTEWKSVGPAPKEKSEALWARFKALGDQAYARTQEGGAATTEERAANLARKEALCVELEALATAAPESVNWRESGERAKVLQEQWKAIGALPKELTRELADALWTRFRTACDSVFSHRKEQSEKSAEERAENIKHLEALCVRVEGVAASATREGTDWKQAAEKVKAAQGEWKAIGFVGRKQSDELWKRFRTACDSFFESRKAAFAKIDDERRENLKQKVALCERAETATLGANDDPVDLIKQLMSEWKKSGPAPREQADAVWDRFRKACDQLRDGGGPAEPELAAPTPTAPAEGISRFANKLPLQHLAAEWERLAESEHEAAAATAAVDAAKEVVKEDARQEMRVAEPSAPPASEVAVDDVHSEWERMAEDDPAKS